MRTTSRFQLQERSLQDHDGADQDAKSGHDDTPKLDPLQMSTTGGLGSGRRSGRGRGFRSTSRDLRRSGRSGGRRTTRWVTTIQLARLVGGAGRRGRDLGSIRHGGDNAIGRGRLTVSRDNTVGTGIDTRVILVITQASLEHVRSVRSGSIVGATDLVVDVVAEECRVGVVGVACLEAEHSGTHEVMPINSLDVVAGVVVALREGIGPDASTDGVAQSIGTPGVELSSGVIGSDVDAGLVDDTRDLDVGRSDEELGASDSAGGHHTGAVGGGGTPGDHATLDIAYNRVGGGTAPDTEVGDGVDVGGLAHGVGSSGGRIALIVTSLGTTADRERVDLIRQISDRRESLAGQRLVGRRGRSALGHYGRGALGSHEGGCGEGDSSGAYHFFGRENEEKVSRESVWVLIVSKR